MRSLLLDTGAWVALLDKSEEQHERCVDFFKTFSGEVFTTEPVLTEVLYLLGPAIKAERACVDFILKGGATLVPQSTTSLARCLTLMEKYHDIPMDYADATLVAFAEETGTHEVFTLDRRGFNAYRIHGKKAFEIRP
ncbi:MAG TPA: PIN domain-containing protein [Nitrospirota bacterium]